MGSVRPVFPKRANIKIRRFYWGLLVSNDGYLLAYDIFPGNKYEGHTMLPVLQGLKTKYNIEKLIVVADSGLLTNANIEELEKNNYEFILGARIKNEKEEIKKEILSSSLKNG